MSVSAEIALGVTTNDITIQEYTIEHVGQIDWAVLNRTVLNKMGETFKTKEDIAKFYSIMKVMLKHGMINRSNGTLYVRDPSGASNNNNPDASEAEKNGRFEAYKWLTDKGVFKWFTTSSVGMKTDELTPLRLCAVIGPIIQKKIGKPLSLNVPTDIHGHLYFGGILRCTTFYGKLAHLIFVSYMMSEDRRVERSFPFSFWYRCMINVSNSYEFTMLLGATQFVNTQKKSDHDTVAKAIASIMAGNNPFTMVSKEKELEIIKDNGQIASLALLLPIPILQSSYSDKLFVSTGVIGVKGFIPPQSKKVYEARQNHIKKLRNAAAKEGKLEKELISAVEYKTDWVSQSASDNNNTLA
jgi:hypothetical protein